MLAISLLEAALGLGALAVLVYVVVQVVKGKEDAEDATATKTSGRFTKAPATIQGTGSFMYAVYEKTGATGAEKPKGNHPVTFTVTNGAIVSTTNADGDAQGASGTTATGTSGRIMSNYPGLITVVVSLDPNQSATISASEGGSALYESIE